MSKRFFTVQMERKVFEIRKGGERIVRTDPGSAIILLDDVPGLSERALAPTIEDNVIYGPWTIVSCPKEVLHDVVFPAPVPVPPAPAPASVPDPVPGLTPGQKTRKIQKVKGMKPVGGQEEKK
jgi:hypothetical protein